MDFDFDKWAQLAKDDPAEFERQREAALRATIAQAPSEHRQRLEGLQFRLNMERQRSSSPLSSCVRLNSLMWAGFYRLRKELNAAARGLSQPAGETRPSAEVIPFRAARSRRGSGEKGGDEK
jgi:hypothetical protein